MSILIPLLLVTVVAVAAVLLAVFLVRDLALDGLTRHRAGAGVLPGDQFWGARPR